LKLKIINIDKNSSDKNLKECIALLLEQMAFIDSVSTFEKVENGLRLALNYQETTKVFAVENSGDEIVGILFANKGASIEKSGYYLWINELYVKDTERNKGVGTKLMNHVFDWCKTEGIRGISLATSVDNETAQNLYHKLGLDSDQVLLFNKKN